MSLTNLAWGLTMPAQFNPSRVEIEIEAFWNRLKIAGRSFEEAQFSNVGNLHVKFDLQLDALAVGAPDLRAYLRDMFAMVYPSEESSPSPIGFVWPNWISIVTFLPKLKFTASRFELDGRPSYGTLGVELEERRSRRLDTDLLRTQGFTRAA